MMNSKTTAWICNECGQDSSDASPRCECCNAPRGTIAAPRAHSATFEIDGQQIRREVEKPLVADSSIANAWADIARINKEQGL